MDPTKRELTLTYGGRAFVVRAYRAGDGPAGLGWCPVVIEDRTPLPHEPGPTPSLARCFAEAVRFVTTAVEAEAGALPAPA